MRYLRIRPLLASVVSTILLSILLLVIFGAVGLSENVDHAMFHLAIAVPAFLLAWSIAFWCPRRKKTRAARWGRGAAIAGLVMSGAAVALEAIGAFGYDGDDSRVDALTTLHNSTWPIDITGNLVLLGGILLGAFSLFQRTPDPIGVSN